MNSKNSKKKNTDGKKLWVRIVVVIIALTTMLGFVLLPLTSNAEEDKSSIVVDEFTTGSLADALNKAMDGTDFNYIKNIAVTGGTLNSADYQALKNIPNIENLELAKAETENGIIPENALDSRNKLAYVSLPKNTKEISKKAFSCNRTLKKVSVPAGVEKIGDYAFESCIVLEKFDVPVTVTYIGEGAFTDCKVLSTFTIPENITEIFGNTFSKSGLTEIFIGPKVTAIGSSAFADCNALKDIYFYGKTAPSVADAGVFQNLKVTVHCSADAEGYDDLASNFVTVAQDFEEKYVAPEAPETEAVYKEEEPKETTVTEKIEEETQSTDAVPASAEEKDGNGVFKLSSVLFILGGACFGVAAIQLINRIRNKNKKL